MTRNLTTDFYNFQTAFLYHAEAFNYGNGASTVIVKDSETREFLHRNFTILHPEERVMVVKHRNDNIFAKIAETMWVLAGRNDMHFLSHYLPRAPQWADDKEHWRAGYGPRLREWSEYYWESAHPNNKPGWMKTSVDQIAKCYNLLLSNPDTRQAVITLWDPAQDWVSSKDIPCNNWLHFMIRDNKLHLAVSVRSNDLVWGFSGINFFEWSVLQEMMAYSLGVEIGQMNWFASSFHVYAHHYERLYNITQDTGQMAKSIYREGIPRLQWDTRFPFLDGVLNSFIHYEAQVREDWKLGWTGSPMLGQNSFIHTCLTLLTAYNAYLQEARPDEVATVLNILDSSDLRIAAIEYFLRKYDDRLPFTASLNLSDVEEEYLFQHDMI